VTDATDPPRALVTGGASGIGAATADLLAERGWTVVRADVAGGDGVVTLDVTDDLAWERALDDAWPLDGLVNSAGIRRRASLESMELGDFDETMEIHTRGVFLSLRGLARRTSTISRPVSVVNIASTVATHAVGGQIAYVAAKGAVAAMTRAGAVELAPRGIRVNAVTPGLIKTPMTADRFHDPAQQSWFAARTPLGRHGEAIEVARLIAFLLSDEASYITGAVYAADGGYTAC
jgi:NAD(P)-dependent dehydrogenase (short-subunit alcohol dehydrogenase family)